MKTSKGVFDIQMRDHQKREAPGIFPVCLMVNPALIGDGGRVTLQV